MLVPERAIGTDQSDKFVYVIDEKNIARRKNVELGTKHGRLRVIKRGLAAGDKVVISGGLLVRAGDEVQPTEGKIEEDSVAVTQYKPPLTEAPPRPSPGAAAPQNTHPAVER